LKAIFKEVKIISAGSLGIFPYRYLAVLKIPKKIWGGRFAVLPLLVKYAWCLAPPGSTNTGGTKEEEISTCQISAIVLTFQACI